MPIKERIASFVCVIGLALVVYAIFKDSMRLGMLGTFYVIGSLFWLPEPSETDDSGIEGADPSNARPADRVGR